MAITEKELEQLSAEIPEALLNGIRKSVQKFGADKELVKFTISKSNYSEELKEIVYKFIDEIEIEEDIEEKVEGKIETIIDPLKNMDMNQRLMLRNITFQSRNNY